MRDPSDPPVNVSSRRRPGPITTGLRWFAKAIVVRVPHSCCGVWVPAFAGTTVTGRRLLQHLEKPRRAHAAADAHGDDRVLRLAAAAFNQSVAGEARARHAVGMAHRDRAAVDIDLVGVDAELVAAIQHLHRESFVQLPQADVVDGQAMTLEQARHGEYRADAHLVRLAAGGDEAAEDAERVQPALCRFLVAHDHARAGAVRKLAGIAGGDRKSLATDGLEAGEAFCGGLGARALVLRQRDVLERDCTGGLVGHRHPGGDRRELILELSALLRRGGAALALQRIFVLLFARDAVALGDDLGGVDHGHVDLALDLEQRRVLRVEAVHLVVLHQRDGLAATADRDLDTVEDHRTRGERDRLQARGALPVDSGAGDGDGETGTEQRLARDVAAGRALLECCAHHDVLDLLGVDLGARDGLADGVAEQRCALGGVERAAIGLPDRGAGGGNDDGVGQERSPDASRVASWADCDGFCCWRNSWRESFPTGVRGRSSTNSTSAGNSCLPSLPASCARSSSSENGCAPGLSLMKAFAASPRYESGMPSTITSCTPGMV